MTRNHLFRCCHASLLLATALALPTPGRAQSLTPLSTLQATAESPLYTTYAASPERSEFTLDQAYHFLFYDTTRSAAFVADRGGDWAIGFRKGNRFISAVGEMFRRPVITASYPDLVSYEFYPFENIRVRGTFLVQSSRQALMHLQIANLTGVLAAIDVIPFIRNDRRAFDSVRVGSREGLVTFSHEQYPDSWVIEHGVPFVDRVQNVVTFSPSPERISSFRSFRWGTVEIPQEINLTKKAVCVIWGRMMHADGERCPHRPPQVRLMAMVNGDRSRMLLENAPRWGSPEENITSYSIYGIELGNFGMLKRADSVTIRFLCSASGEGGSLTAPALAAGTSARERIDIRFGPADSLRPPQNVRRDIWGNGTEVRLYWKKGNGRTRANVYRRDYREGGVYRLVAENLTQTFYTEKNVQDDRIYGYVVTSVDERGRMSMPSPEVNNIEGSDFVTDIRFPGQVKGDARDLVRVISASKHFDLAPDSSADFRMVRSVRRPNENEDSSVARSRSLLAADLTPYVRENERLFSRVPLLPSASPDQQMVNLSAFSLMRQVMLPPEGKCGYNYYVFSREPQWGWGHGGQVFHESLTMLAYALLDPPGAMNSQRVFRERQHGDGYINYRTGPYLDETIPTAGQLTTSAPWYAWQNWEVFAITKDRDFLKEMYESSKQFYRYYVSRRDADNDGLCEWGGEAVLESVRDARVAVWDEVAWPSRFEGLDLNCMLVQEARSLAAMARELGQSGEADEWESDATARSRRINETMWDDQTGFYYHVDRKNHGFTYSSPNDLKRQEIIGFLPLWAGVADSSRAARLVRTLTDTSKFWRRYGVPSLAADDRYFNAKGYWNGPVWVQWNYLIERGLLRYGYRREAKELVNRVSAVMSARLKLDHNFWEFYSPDEEWGGYHATYIWAGIIARMMKDVQE